MLKSPFQMIEEEREVWCAKSRLQTRNYLFSIGQPLVYKKDGRMIAEYADGRVELLD